MFTDQLRILPLIKNQKFENKKPDIIGLVTNTVFNTIVGKFENRKPDISGIVTITIFITKIKEFEKNPYYDQYITTAIINKLSGEIRDAKLNQAKLTTNKDLTDVEERAIEKKHRNIRNI